MSSTTQQNLCLSNEVYTSTMLIKKGFSELQSINGSNDFYHIPILLISSGFERLMKCIVCYWHLKIDDNYPSNRDLRRLGHNLDTLLNEIIKICNKFENYDERPAIRKDLDFLKNNERLHNIITILSDFSQGGRYYNLDIVSIGGSGFSDPEDKWQELETQIVLEDPQIEDLMKDPTKSDEMYERINMILMRYLEQFARALSRIFTLGELHEKAQTNYGYISDFLNIMDDQLGKNAY